MRISRSTGYAIIAVCHIAKSEDKLVISHDISKAYGIPLEYLLKIMQQLVRANVLRSKRGPKGGFSLAKPANKITMLEIIEASEGPMTGSASLFEENSKEKFCIKAEKANEKAIAQAVAVYEKTKLSDMIK